MSPRTLLRLALTALLLTQAALLSSAALALDSSTFSACTSQLQAHALKRGISKAVVERDLAVARFLPDVIEKDRFQPEFTDDFATYFNRRITETRISRGRALLAEHRQLLDGIAAQYGIPAEVLVSFWGLETNYGTFFGDYRVIDALSTLACDGRRSNFFRDELMNALRIIDEGSATADSLRGSWAGALGHMQFMPSTFVRHAVDADGDGRRDLWGSTTDAMTSAGKFLRALGWQSDTRWGEEVLLPENFAHQLAGSQKTVQEWQALGVRRANGKPLPANTTESTLLIPTGHAGPAFLVQQNFRVIMRWNRSEAYALAVAHLADRLRGADAFTRAPVNAPRLNREQVKHLQAQLNQAGFKAGTPDGVFGPATRQAIAGWQRERGMVADGFPSQSVLDELGVLMLADNGVIR